MVVILMLGIIPAALVILGGKLILRTSPEITGERHFILYLLSVGTALNLVVFIAVYVTGESLFPILGILLAPSVLGILAATLTRFKALAGLTLGGKAIALLLGLSSLALLAGIWGQPFSWVQAIVPGALLLAVVWTLASTYPPLVVLLSLVILALLAFENTGLYHSLLLTQPTWLASLSGFSLNLTPGLTVTLAAVSVTSGARYLKQAKEAGPAAQERARGAACLGLAAVLLGSLAYTILWASIWDQTSDGLGGILVASLASLTAIGAGMLMELSLGGPRRTVSLAFSALVPVVMFGFFWWGWQISYHEITEKRAARIQHALERFHQRTGVYPAVLEELVPGDLLWIPDPVILRGQVWCYQGEDKGYILGTFYRDNFSAPLSLHIYASAGNSPPDDWRCEQKLAELKERYDPPLIH